MAEPGLCRIAAQFASEAELVAAAQRLHRAGFAGFEAYSPYPIPALTGLAAPQRSPVGRIAFLGGAAGLIGSLALQEYATVLGYPLNIGGRPLDSWPMYVPSSYEAAVGSAVVTVTVALLWLLRLPRLHHPDFDTPDFARASSDGFFLVVSHGVEDATYHRLHEELGACGPLAITDLRAR